MATRQNSRDISTLAADFRQCVKGSIGMFIATMIYKKSIVKPLFALAEK